MSQDKSDRMSEDMFARSSERMCQKECVRMSSRQDTTRSCKNPEKKDAGRAAFEMFGLFQRTFSTLFDVFLLVHGIKLDDNHNLTTPTQHVMVGITRSKVILAKKTSDVFVFSRAKPRLDIPTTHDARRGFRFPMIPWSMDLD